MIFAFPRQVAALLCAAFIVISSFSGAAAQTTDASISGLVIDQHSALPVANASVVLSGAGATPRSTTTDASGRYKLAGIAPGVYSLTVTAAGYSPANNADVVIASGTTASLDAALSLATTTSRGDNAVIGRISTSANVLSAATTMSQKVDVENITQKGQIRVVDQLGTLPATNVQTSSSVGDDTTVNLRGLGTDETASLFDGHPVGPLGVGSGGFNFSLGPAYGLSSLQVTYGSGAQGLYGSDTIGGAVDYMTINPTPKSQVSFQQQIGGFGLLSTGLTATGTYGKLGYAFAAARFGEYGDFAPGLIAQTARPEQRRPEFGGIPTVRARAAPTM